MNNSQAFPMFKRAGFNLSSHDIRRTVASLLRNELRATVDDIGLILDHSVGSVNQSLIHGVQDGTSGKEQIATELGLVGRVTVVKTRALLLFQIQRNAQAARIGPTVTDLGQSPYGVLISQCACELVQGLERTAHKAVTLLQCGDSLLSGLAFDPFVTIEHNLYPKRGYPLILMVMWPQSDSIK